MKLTYDIAMNYAVRAAPILRLSVPEVLWSVPAEMVFGAVASHLNVMPWRARCRQKHEARVIHSAMEQSDIIKKLREARKQLGTERPKR